MFVIGLILAPMVATLVLLRYFRRKRERRF